MLFVNALLPGGNKGNNDNNLSLYVLVLILFVFCCDFEVLLAILDGVILTVVATDPVTF